MVPIPRRVAHNALKLRVKHASSRSCSNQQLRILTLLAVVLLEGPVVQRSAHQLEEPLWELKREGVLLDHCSEDEEEMGAPCIHSAAVSPEHFVESGGVRRDCDRGERLSRLRIVWRLGGYSCNCSRRRLRRAFLVPRESPVVLCSNGLRRVDRPGFQM